MALYYFTGFEGFKTSPTTNDEPIASTGTRSVQNTTARNGGYALQTNPTTTQTGYVAFATFTTTAGRPTATAISTPKVTFYFRVGTLPASNSEVFCQFLAGTSYKGEFRVHSDGSVSLWNGVSATPTLTEQSSAGVISTNTWYRIDIEATNSTTGAYILKVDNTIILSGTANWQSANALGFSRFGLGKYINRNGQTVNFYYDDLWIDDSTAMEAGDFRVKLRLPISDGFYTGWTGAYTEVDEITPDDATTMITQGGATATRSTIMQSCSTVGISSGATIKAVKSCAYIRESVSITSGFRVGINNVSGTQVGTSSNLNASTAWNAQCYQRVTNVSGGAWTIALVDEAETYIIANTTASTHQCSALRQEVAYIEPVVLSTYFANLFGGFSEMSGGFHN
jgi:hypothetical protein